MRETVPVQLKLHDRFPPQNYGFFYLHTLLSWVGFTCTCFHYSVYSRILVAVTMVTWYQSFFAPYWDTWSIQEVRNLVAVTMVTVFLCSILKHMERLGGHYSACKEDGCQVACILTFFAQTTCSIKSFFFINVFFFSFFFILGSGKAVSNEVCFFLTQNSSMLTPKHTYGTQHTRGGYCSHSSKRRLAQSHLPSRLISSRSFCLASQVLVSTYSW